jgi:sugar phosphate permease
MLRTFVLTWTSYASYYITRKNFSVAKATMQKVLKLSTGTLAAIDFAYLGTYALGQFLWGGVADRIGPRRVIGIGMLATAAMSAIFGLSSSAALLILIWGLNGLAQSTGWSANLKAMTMAMPPGARGRIMGLWSTCYQVGSLVANPIAGLFLGLTVIGWRLAFFAPAVWVAAIGGLILVALPEGKVPVAASPQASLHAEIARERARVLRTPVVWAIGASYFFMKLIRYVLQLWLPYYLTTALDYSPGLASVVSTAFEIGGFIGAVAVGFVSDRFFRGRRVPVGLVSLVLLAGAMMLYAQLAKVGVVANFGGLMIVGFFLFGPDTLLSATAAQDIGGPAAAATSAGVINGLGSIGALVSPLVTPWVSKHWGWTGLYQLLGAGAVVGALVLVPFLRDRKEA